MRRLSLGQYVRGDSPLHRMDPRVKLVLMGLFMVSVFFARTPWGLLPPTLLLAAAVGVSGVGVRPVARMCRPLIVFVAFTFVANVALVQTGAVLLRLGPVAVTADGVLEALVLSWRILALMLAGVLVALTTPPTVLTDGAEALLAPLARLGVPVGELATMFTIAVRFVPTLSDELHRIAVAQASRGAALDEGSLLERARVLLSMIVPLFASALRHAENLGDAMEARCYEGGPGRSHYHVLAFSRTDALAVVVFAAYLAALIATRLA